MKILNIALILALVACSVSLVTSRQQQRLDYTAMVQAQKQATRLDQDYQNLKSRQQALEKTERVERIARTKLFMERAPIARLDYIKPDANPAKTD
jgi:cell division protein FtsL